MKRKRKRIVNEKEARGDGSVVYRIIRYNSTVVRHSNGQTIETGGGRMGISVVCKPFEPRREIARRLWKARRDLVGIRAACGR